MEGENKMSKIFVRKKREREMIGEGMKGNKKEKEEVRKKENEKEIESDISEEWNFKKKKKKEGIEVSKGRRELEKIKRMNK